MTEFERLNFKILVNENTARLLVCLTCNKRRGKVLMQQATANDPILSDVLFRRTRFDHSQMMGNNHTMLMFRVCGLKLRLEDNSYFNPVIRLDNNYLRYYFRQMLGILPTQ